MTSVSLRASAPLWQKKLVYVVLIMLYVLIIKDFKVVAQETDFKEAVLKEVNALRASGCNCGDEVMPPAPPLKWNDKLETAAIRHVNDMYENQHFDHKGTDGSTMSDRINATGYKWSMLGENICWGHEDVTSAIRGWKDSEDHCRNMMSSVFKDIAVARKGSYWVMDLGSPKF